MILEELKSYLDHVELGDTRLYLGEFADEPDRCVVMIETAGLGGMRTQDKPGLAYEQPRLQVVARDKNYFDARTLARDVFNALVDIKNTYIENVWYLSIDPLQSPFFLRRDERDRINFAFNIDVTKEVS